jgi:hypothetical protein
MRILDWTVPAVMHLWNRRRHSLVLLLGVILACQASEEAHDVTTEFRLHQVRQIGEFDGPLSFGIITALAAHPNGVLAVADWSSCDIALIELAHGKLIRRFGRCGNGPGEFSMIRSLSLSADSLLVLDAQSSRVQILDYYGNEGRRLTFDALRKLSAASIAQVDMLNDTTWLLSLALPNTAAMQAVSDDRGHRLLAYADARTGALRATFHRDDDISINNQNAVRRMVISCVSPHNPHSIAVFSVWTFVGAAYAEGETIPTATFEMLIDWASPRQLRPRHWLWPPGFYDAECGQRFAVFRYMATEEHSQFVDRGHLEIRGFAGGLLVAQPLTRADSAFFGRAPQWVTACSSRPTRSSTFL